MSTTNEENLSSKIKLSKQKGSLELPVSPSPPLNCDYLPNPEKTFVSIPFNLLNALTYNILLAPLYFLITRNGYAARLLKAFYGFHFFPLPSP